MRRGFAAFCGLTFMIRDFRAMNQCTHMHTEVYGFMFLI